MSKIQIKDIARELGVSTTTVSLVLNGKAKENRVRNEVIQKVEEMAKVMNYQPNSLAKSLRLGKTFMIGLLVADISNPFFANLAFHIQACAEQAGYIVVVVNTNESTERMQNAIEALKSRQVDGLIVIPTANSMKYIEKTTKTKMPMVLVDRMFPDMQMSHVIIDNFFASKKAVQHLIDKGCKRIALFMFDNPLHHMQERRRGYLSALSGEELESDGLTKELTHENLNADMSKAMDGLIVDGKLSVDGMFFATNSISLAGMKQLLERQIVVSQDVQIVCFDHNDVFDLTPIKIPYVSQPIDEIGKMAVNTLIKQIENPDSISKVEVATSLVNI